MLRNVNQPGQDGIRVHLEHPGDSADAQALSQRAHRPHQPLGRHALAMQWRAMGLLEVAATAGAMQLSPWSTAGMPIGAEIAEPHPALIRTVRIRAEMPRGIHLVRPSPR